ncbi:MAG TPA: rhodanese-like domain-containing protein [Thermodesulfobacteriota bacterium]|nr:rhodanese-like domain-containing protein [Thermodesulfobacteriota bacterium]
MHGEKRVSSFFLIFGFAFLILTGSVWAADKELEIEKAAVKFQREVERGGYKVVTTQELKGWLDQKKEMLIVDTMPASNFKKEHIPGAVNFELQRPELEQMSEKMKADFETLLGPDKERTIVFYCGFTDCERSHNGAMWAKRLGYKNAYRQPGGIKGWLEAGYPVAK